jgi:hypothetical protein
MEWQEPALRRCHHPLPEPEPHLRQTVPQLPRPCDDDARDASRDAPK